MHFIYSFVYLYYCYYYYYCSVVAAADALWTAGR